MNNKSNNLVNICREELGMSLVQRSEHVGIPKSTLESWISKNRVSALGETALKLLLSNHQLENELKMYQNMKNTMLEMADSLRDSKPNKIQIS